MKDYILASTMVGVEPDIEQFKDFSAKQAGVCYMPNDIVSILNEEEIKTQKRLNNILTNKHLSPFEHCSVTFHFVGLPKIMAMELNNCKLYATSEKSGRYTVFDSGNQIETDLYNKWQEIIREQIDKTYVFDPFENKTCLALNGSRATREDIENGNIKWVKIPYLSDNNRKKLSMETARYFQSIMTPVAFTHTLNLRQINNIYNWAGQILDEENSHPIHELMKPSLKELRECFENRNLVVDGLFDEKGSSFSLIQQDRKLIGGEQFGEYYATQYKGSFAQLAQALRHRTLDYSMSLPPEEDKSFYTPVIILDNKDLCEEWQEDMQKVKYPLGQMVDITEGGHWSKFILKTKERLCVHAQLEINKQTVETLNKYVSSLKVTSPEQAEIMERFTKGARCTFPKDEYQCKSPCGFKEGVTMERQI